MAHITYMTSNFHYKNTNTLHTKAPYCDNIINIINHFGFSNTTSQTITANYHAKQHTRRNITTQSSSQSARAA